MKHLNALNMSVTMEAALLLISASAAGVIPLSLPLATVVGLGIPAGVLLVAHRAQLAEILHR